MQARLMGQALRRLSHSHSLSQCILIFINQTIGSQVMVKIVKNKFAPPYRTAEFELEFGMGTSRLSEVIGLSLKHNLLPKSPKFSRERNSQTFSARRRKRERGTYDETQRDYFRLTKLTKRMQRNLQKGNR